MENCRMRLYLGNVSFLESCSLISESCWFRSPESKQQIHGIGTQLQLLVLKQEMLAKNERGKKSVPFRDRMEI